MLLLKQSEIRFVSIAERVHAEAKRAYEEWSHFTAMRDQAHIDGKELKPSLRIGGFDEQAGLVQRSLARSAILRCYRLSDSPEGSPDTEHWSLHQLARELAETKFVRFLLSVEWASARFANQVKDLTDQRCASIERLTSSFAHVGRDNTVAGSLADLRSKLRATRNEVVHAVDPRDDFPTVDEIEQLIRLTLELSSDAVMLSTGNNFDVSDFCRRQDERAQEFWKLAFARAAER